MKEITQNALIGCHYNHFNVFPSNVFLDNHHMMFYNHTDHIEIPYLDALTEHVHLNGVDVMLYNHIDHKQTTYLDVVF